MYFAMKKKILTIFMSAVLLAGGCYFMASALMDSSLIAQRESSGSEAVLEGAGCNFQSSLNADNAAKLYAEGYRYVGRYLTGGDCEKMTLQEYRDLSDSGLKVVPLFGTGSSEDYFSYEQGKNDCDLAVRAAGELFLPQSATIYFEVNSDAVDSDSAISYFKGINDQMREGKYNSKHQIGVYGSKNICTDISKENLAKYSFVINASENGESEVMPDNWAFAQTGEKANCDGTIRNKGNASGKDAGNSLDTSYHGGSYDREAVKEYLQKYAKNPNSLYIKYSSDCANFVSQCIAAGGIPQTSAWYYDERILKGDETVTKSEMDVGEPWRKAHAQYEYFASPENGYIRGDVVIISSAEEIPEVLKQCEAEENPILPGDLMYFTPKGQGGNGTRHAAIVSEVSSDKIRYAAHSQKRCNEILSARQFKYDDICIIRMRDQK